MTSDDSPVSGASRGPDELEVPEIESTLHSDLRRTHGEGIDPAVELKDDGDTPSSRLESLSKSKTDVRYVLKGEVGRGGMGVVLKVFDKDLRRNLAMKVILGKSSSGSGDSSTVDPGMLSRFLEEAQVTGQLDHPGVVPVHELGVDAEGRVYFTMQLVRGRTLKEVFDLVRDGDPEWSLTRALGILQKVCEAMAYAHDKGVIHRDLKPANIMVGKYGEVYVMDWGLARVEGREDSRDIRLEPSAVSSLSKVRTDREEDRDSEVDSPLITMDGAVVGTPAYMPLEQALGQVENVDRRSDVYSVGAMLYQLLSGCVPYTPSGARISSRTILMGVISGPPKPVREVAQIVPPVELEAICEKAMARDAGARYANMGELADDLRAYVEGRVVKAHRIGAVVEFNKWVQRNRALAATVATASIILMAVLIGFSVVFAKKNVALTEIIGQRNDAIDASEVRGKELSSLNLELERERDRLAKSTSTLQGHRLARLAREEIASSPESALRLAIDASRHVDDAVTRSALVEASGHPVIRAPFSEQIGEVSSVAFTPDGRWAATASGQRTLDGKQHADHCVRVFEAETGLLRSCRFVPGGPTWVGFDDGGTRLAIGVDRGERVQIFDLQSQEVVGEIKGPPSSEVVYVTPGFESAGFLMTTAEGKDLHVVDALTGSTVAQHEWDLTRIAQDRRTALTLIDGFVRTIDCLNGALLSEIGAVSRLCAYSHDLEYVAVYTERKGSAVALEVWDTATGSLFQTLHSSTRFSKSGSFVIDSDGEWMIATEGQSGEEETWLWNMKMGVRQFRFDAYRPLRINFQVPGRAAVAASSPSGTRIFSVISGDVLLDVPHSASGLAAFSPDGTYFIAKSTLEGVGVMDIPRLDQRPLAVSTEGNAVVRRETDAVLVDHRGQQLLELDGGTSGRERLLLSPDGQRAILWSTRSEAARIYDLQSGVMLANVMGPTHNTNSGFSSSTQFNEVRWDFAGVRVRVGTKEDLLEFDALNGELLERTPMVGNYSSSANVCLCRDGSRIAHLVRDFPGSDTALVTVWAVGEEQPLWSEQFTAEAGSRRSEFAIGFSDDGSRIAITAETQLQVFDVDSGAMVVDLELEYTARELRFSPEGNYVHLTGAGSFQVGEGTWLKRSILVHLTPSPRVLNFDDCQIDPTWKYGVSRTRAGDIELFELDTNDVRTRIDDDALLSSVSFSSNGRRVAVALDGQSVEVWDTALHEPIARFSVEPTLAAQVVLSPDGAYAAVFREGGTRFWVAELDSSRVSPSIVESDIELSELVFGPTSLVVIGTGTGPDGLLRCRAWDTRTGASLVDLPGSEVQVNLETRRIALGDETGWCILDAESMAPLLRLVPGKVRVLEAQFDSTGQHLFCGGRDGPSSRGVVYDAHTKARAFEFEYGGSVRFSPNGHLVSFASDRSRVLKILRTVDGHVTREIRDVQGRYLMNYLCGNDVSVFAAFQSDKSADVYIVDNFGDGPVQPILSIDGGILDLAIDEAERRVLVVSRNGVATMADIEAAEVVDIYNHVGLVSGALHPDGSSAFLGTRKGLVLQVDFTLGATKELYSAQEQVGELLVSASGRFLAIRLVGDRATILDLESETVYFETDLAKQASLEFLGDDFLIAGARRISLEPLGHALELRPRFQNIAHDQRFGVLIPEALGADADAILSSGSVDFIELAEEYLLRARRVDEAEWAKTTGRALAKGFLEDELFVEQAMDRVWSTPGVELAVREEACRAVLGAGTNWSRVVGIAELRLRTHGLALESYEAAARLLERIPRLPAPYTKHLPPYIAYRRGNLEVAREAFSSSFYALTPRDEPVYRVCSRLCWERPYEMEINSVIISLVSGRVSIDDIERAATELRGSSFSNALIAGILEYPSVDAAESAALGAVGQDKDARGEAAQAIWAACYSADAWILEEIAWAFVVSPTQENGNLFDVERRDSRLTRIALGAATRAQDLRPSDLAIGKTLGAAQYSAGLFAEASQTLRSVIRRRSMKEDANPEAWDFLFLAAACHQNGEPAEAAKALARARECVKEGGVGGDELRGLLAVEEMLGR